MAAATGHPARLNFGDCLSYAVARKHHAPLLFKGEDFAHTDVKRALLSRAASSPSDTPMTLHIVDSFSRIGEENAFAVLARATELQRQGKDIINLGIGQPDFPTPPHIVEAAVKALRDGHHGYTPATGILPLREAVRGLRAPDDGRGGEPGPGADRAGRQGHHAHGDLDVRRAGARSSIRTGFPIYRSMIEFTGATPIPCRSARRTASPSRRRNCSR